MVREGLEDRRWIVQGYPELREVQSDRIIRDYRRYPVLQLLIVLLVVRECPWVQECLVYQAVHPDREFLGVHFVPLGRVFLGFLAFHSLHPFLIRHSLQVRLSDLE